MTQTIVPVPPRSFEATAAIVRSGAGRFVIRTYTRITIITAKNLAAWEKTGQWLIREDGDGYRIRRGKTSDYLYPGTLELVQP